MTNQGFHALPRRKITHQYMYDGLSTRQLADIYKVSHATIGRILKSMGVSLRPSGTPRNFQELRARNKAIVNLYVTGQGSSKELSKHFNLTQRQVNSILRNADAYTKKEGNTQ